MIKLNLTEKEMEELLEQYYLEFEGISAKVHFCPETVYEGIYETKSIEPRIKVTRMMKLMGCERSVEETKGKSEIIKCLNKALARDGYSLENIRVYKDTDRCITTSSVQIDVKQLDKGKVKVYETNSTRQY